MRNSLRSLLVLSLLAYPVGAAGQQYELNEATYITAEQIDAVNELPGVDRQIISRDIGKLNLSVGIIHRGATGPAAAGRGGGGNAAANPTCGVTSGRDSGARGIAHDHQTETYIIWSGAGTLVTGGSILNGSQSAPESSVTTTLNGPSCSGQIVGDVKTIEVKEGDVIIIPAGVPHGWLNVPDHVDYLSVRPDPDRVLSDEYVHPTVQGQLR
jgi:mannose-6-phosphate isomerase-like protein (cupin superfamily)